MKCKVNELVIPENNRDQYNKVIGLMQRSDRPRFYYLAGPSGSGKTTLMSSVSAELHHLTGESIYTHPSEILMALTVENPYFEERLDAIGTSSLLFIDDIEDFLENKQLGPRALRLLVSARKMHGLDTVLASKYSIDFFTEQCIKDALEGFEVIELIPLNAPA